jgi:hypothetical protein
MVTADGDIADLDNARGPPLVAVWRRTVRGAAHLLLSAFAFARRLAIDAPRILESGDGIGVDDELTRLGIGDHDHLLIPIQSHELRVQHARRTPVFGDHVEGPKRSGEIVFPNLGVIHAAKLSHRISHGKPALFCCFSLGRKFHPSTTVAKEILDIEESDEEHETDQQDRASRLNPLQDTPFDGAAPD